MATKKQYVDSHWLIFAIQGLVALVFGWLIMFTNLAGTHTLVAAVGTVLLALGIIEIINVLNRRRKHFAWGLALTIAIVEIGVGLSLLLTKELSVAVHLSIIAGYTTVRGLFEVMIAVRSLSDLVTKILWIVTGAFGMVLGFVIFNSGNIDLANTTFIKLFGTYMMVFGLTNIIFGLHRKTAIPAKTKKK